ncbi:MAG: NTP transferase domain-containing protein [Pikeienuella sp.]
MKFGPLQLAEAEGAVLAHSLGLPGGRLKKGRRLSVADLERLRAAGHAEVIAARLDPTDIAEDTAAARIAAAIAPEPAALGLTVSAPFTGRVNLFAAEAGLATIDKAAVDALNGIDEAVTVATLADASRLAPRQMVATIKIIPYAVSETAVAAAELAARPGMIALSRRCIDSAGLLLTRTVGMGDALVEKGAAAVRARLATLGIHVAEERVVAHETAAVAEALTSLTGEMALILTGSATSDRADVGPASLVAAGGRLTRFGMPVDPGNLLFLGEQAHGSTLRPVIGLPGCARSPKLNGADWVLERLAHGRAVDTAAIAAMGVGGLLKEIPSRPAPREGGGAGDAPMRPRVSILLLAGGASRRMRGRDKLLEEIDGEPLLARTARAALASAADETLVVLPPGASGRIAALDGLGLRFIEAARAPEGMGASIASGLAALSPAADAVLLLFADMPEIGAPEIDRLIAAFDPAEGRAIVRATTEDGTPGHPVLFGRRFFEPLRALAGDAGAREILAEHRDFVVDLPLPGQAALTDLDTPEAWAEWRGRASPPHAQ